MKYYVGIDLHSNNNYIGIINGKGEKIFRERISNDKREIIECLRPYKKGISGIVIESTYNWYWLVDTLMEKGYKVHLANPAGAQQYKGLKYTDDQSDALWLAEMLRLKILPEGYIYPKEERAVRDLLRKRLILVETRTAILLQMRGMISNCTGKETSRTELIKLSVNGVEKLFNDTYQIMSVNASKEVIITLNDQIEKIEKEVIKIVKLKKEFESLLTVTGIGKILGITIMLETGDLGRFRKVGNYSSYSRCVPTEKLSNDKVKGKGNKKNGNSYLSRAYTEAAYYMVRYCPYARKWYQKKAAKKGSILAIRAISNKIAKACYFIMRDNIPYDASRMFN